MGNKRQIGAIYEEKATEYLKNNGYDIVSRNYRTRFGEIDIIAKQDRTFVFCEVKYRASSNYGDPAEAVNRAKQKKICRVALWYLKEQGLGENTPGRFDVITINGENIAHIQNAFPFGY